MLSISWVAAQLAASQEGLSSMSEWVSLEMSGFYLWRRFEKVNLLLGGCPQFLVAWEGIQAFICPRVTAPQPLESSLRIQKISTIWTTARNQTVVLRNGFWTDSRVLAMVWRTIKEALLLKLGLEILCNREDKRWNQARAPRRKVMKWWRKLTMASNPTSSECLNNVHRLTLLVVLAFRSNCYNGTCVPQKEEGKHCMAMMMVVTIILWVVALQGTSWSESTCMLLFMRIPASHSQPTRNNLWAAYVDYSRACSKPLLVIQPMKIQ
jgi:hypothetical protein